MNKYCRMYLSQITLRHMIHAKTSALPNSGAGEISRRIAVVRHLLPVKLALNRWGDGRIVNRGRKTKASGKERFEASGTSGPRPHPRPLKPRWAGADKSCKKFKAIRCYEEGNEHSHIILCKCLRTQAATLMKPDSISLESTKYVCPPCP